MTKEKRPSLDQFQHAFGVFGDDRTLCGDAAEGDAANGQAGIER